MSTRIVIVAIGLGLGYASGTAAAEPHALHLRGGRLFVDVVVNGKPYEALLDSAAEMTFIDDDVARALGLPLKGDEMVKGSGGQEPVKFAAGVNVQSVDTTLTNRTVAVLDLHDLSTRLVGADVPMILGRELFDAGRFEIDIESGSIRRLDRASMPGGVRLPLTTERGIESFPVTLEGSPVQADIDLGNGSDVLLGKAYAQEAGILRPERIVERKQGGGLGGPVERDIVMLSTLEIAGVRFQNIRAAVDPQPSAGDLNVGVSVLRRFVLVLDFPEHAIWLRARDQ